MVSKLRIIWKQTDEAVVEERWWSQQSAVVFAEASRGALNPGELGKIGPPQANKIPPDRKNIRPDHDMTLFLNLHYRIQLGRAQVVSAEVVVILPKTPDTRADTDTIAIFPRGPPGAFPHHT